MNFSSSCCLGFRERLVELLKNFKFLTSLNSVAYKLLLIKDTKCITVLSRMSFNEITNYSEVQNIFFMKSWMEGHRIRQLSSATNLAGFDSIQAKLAALPSLWIQFRISFRTILDLWSILFHPTKVLLMVFVI